MLYELVSASDPPILGSREKESTGSSKFADNSDWTPYADPQQRLYAPTLDEFPPRKFLIGTTNPCDCAPATSGELANVMTAIWDRAPSGFEYVPDFLTLLGKMN